MAPKPPGRPWQAACYGKYVANQRKSRSGTGSNLLGGAPDPGWQLYASPRFSQRENRSASRRAQPLALLLNLLVPVVDKVGVAAAGLSTSTTDPSAGLFVPDLAWSLLATRVLAGSIVIRRPLLGVLRTLFTRPTPRKSVPASRSPSPDSAWPLGRGTARPPPPARARGAGKSLTCPATSTPEGAIGDIALAWPRHACDATYREQVVRITNSLGAELINGDRACSSSC